jgi:serine protease AprX
MAIQIIRRTTFASLTLALAILATPALAQHRARLGADLEAQLASGDTDISVIVHGSRAEVDALATEYGVRVARYLKSGAVLKVNAGQLDALRGSTALDHLSSDAIVQSNADVTRETIGAIQVWAGTASNNPLNGRGVGVAVIDSGVDPRHTALAGRVVASVDFTGGDSVDRYGHGTHVAALIAGNASPNPLAADYQGVAPGASIVNLRVLDDSGMGRASSVIDAIDWAIEHQREFNIRVINLSLGAPVVQSYRDDPLCEAAARATAAGIIVVAAAGNFGVTADGTKVFGGITAPANAPFVIAVGALDTKGTADRLDDGIAKFSSRGPTLYDELIKPDLVAPGRNVVSAEAAGSLLAVQHPERHVTGSGAEGYISLSGSSMSAGVVSGAVALLLDRVPSLGPDSARVVLQASSSVLPLEGLLASGAGSLDLVMALRLLQSPAVGRYALSPTASNGVSSSDVRFVQGIADSKGAPTIVLTQNGAHSSMWYFSASDAATSAQASRDTIIWGQASRDTIIWGQTRQDTIIWGQVGRDTIIWGQAARETIIWGQTSWNTIIWGQVARDTIIWGQAARSTIIWGQALRETIIWGQAAPGTIIWGQSFDSD